MGLARSFPPQDSSLLGDRTPKNDWDGTTLMRVRPAQRAVGREHKPNNENVLYTAEANPIEPNGSPDRRQSDGCHGLWSLDEKVPLVELCKGANERIRCAAID